MAAVSNNEGVMLKQNKGNWLVAKFHNDGGIKLNAADTTSGSGVPVWGANSAGETVNSMNILSAQINAGGANNVYFTVKRGASTVLVLSGQDYLDLSDGRLVDSPTAMATSNLQVIRTGSGPATLILHLHKQVTVKVGSEY
jgi:hypothetical protein